MFLPEPTLSFTIPSLYDQVLLSCRLFLPEETKSPFQRKGVIVAHPYAPIGGSSDNHVVNLVGSVFLQNGYSVLTFNFRGAGDSGGRTSWTGKPEISDYTSVAAFFIELLSQLDHVSVSSPTLQDSDDDGSIKMVFGGYSYGSLIATRLPDVSEILTSLLDQSKAAIEIRTKAKDLSAQINKDLATIFSQTQQSVLGEETVRRSFDHTLAVGAEEDSKAHAKHGHHPVDVRKSMDNVSRRLSKHFKHQSSNSKTEQSTERSNSKTELSPISLPSISAAYLLISPLLPPISSLTTFSFSFSFSSDSSADEHLQKFKSHPSLAVFGGQDIFTSAKKLRPWCSELTESSQRFRWVEITEASHFWTEKGVAKRLGNAVKEWIGEIEKDS